MKKFLTLLAITGITIINLLSANLAKADPALNNSDVADNTMPINTMPMPVNSPDQQTPDQTPNLCAIGTADNPVTVNEYVQFLNDQYKTGQKTLTFWQSWTPDKYAVQDAKSSDSGYDTTLMKNGYVYYPKFLPDIPKVTPYAYIFDNIAFINFNYSWKVDPHNYEIIDYTFSYSAVEGKGDCIIASVLNPDVVSNFNNWRQSQAITSQPAGN